MNITFGILWNTVQKQDKCFHCRPKFFFNLKEQHRCGCFSKDIIENDKVVYKKGNFEFPRVLISLQQSLDILKMI